MREFAQIIYVIYSITTCYLLVVESSFHIEKSGHYSVDLDDVGIRFYLTVVNNAGYRLVVTKARQPECCWTVTAGDEDCESMTLFGGFQLVLDKTSSKNMTFVFSNTYPLDRVGSCKFFLKELDVPGTIVHDIKFDTTLKQDISTVTNGGIRIFKRCTGIDQNIRDNCNPFNCAKKYNGFRSYYNKVLGKCQAVARCSTKLDEDNLPTTAFDFENNRCKSLVPHLTKSEKEKANEILDSSPLVAKRDSYVDVNAEEFVINCRNGYQDGNYCRCHQGWKTVSMTTKHGGIEMNWCSKKVPVMSTKTTPRYAKWIIFGVRFDAADYLWFLFMDWD